MVLSALRAGSRGMNTASTCSSKRRGDTRVEIDRAGQDSSTCSSKRRGDTRVEIDRAGQDSWFRVRGLGLRG
jgi:hypothetical protein